MPLHLAARELLTSTTFLWTWGALVAVSVVVLFRDLVENNPEFGGLMKMAAHA